MIDIPTILRDLRTSWQSPREAIHRGKRSPFLLRCILAPEGIAHGELTQFPKSVPKDVQGFWQEARTAELFKDEQYGQWGLELFAPDRALRETLEHTQKRPREFFQNDLILGRFLGDSDLLVVRCAAGQKDYGWVTVALPLDKRKDWCVAAESFSEFLSRFVSAQGGKYWE